MANVMKELGKGLGKIRKQKKISQEVAAKKAGLSRKTISNLETGAHTGLYETLEKYAKALGVKLEAVA